jgi:hypothetical protein
MALDMEQMGATADAVDEQSAMHAEAFDRLMTWDVYKWGA